MQGGELTPGWLMVHTQVASGTMTNRVTRLDDRGFVTREPDPDDGRGVLVRLTAAGRKKVDAAAIEIAAAEADHLEGRSAPASAIKSARP